MKNKNTSDYFTIVTKEYLTKYRQQYLPVKVTVYMGSGQSTTIGEDDSSGCTSMKLSSPEGRLKVDAMN